MLLKHLFLLFSHFSPIYCWFFLWFMFFSKHLFCSHFLLAVDIIIFLVKRSTKGVRSPTNASSPIFILYTPAFGLFFERAKTSWQIMVMAWWFDNNCDISDDYNTDDDNHPRLTELMTVMSMMMVISIMIVSLMMIIIHFFIQVMIVMLMTTVLIIIVSWKRMPVILTRSM